MVSGQTAPKVRIQEDILKCSGIDQIPLGWQLKRANIAKATGHALSTKPKHRHATASFGPFFRACLTRFRDCAATGTAFGTVSWEFCSGPGGRRVYSRKQEEFMADFCLVSRRVLDEEDHRLFRFYFLLGAD